MPKDIKHEYIPVTLEQKLAYLVEESGEVLGAAGKSLRWGIDSVNPEVPPEQQVTNGTWLLSELHDLKRAIGYIEDEMGNPLTTIDDCYEALAMEVAEHNRTYNRLLEAKAELDNAQFLIDDLRQERDEAVEEVIGLDYLEHATLESIIIHGMVGSGPWEVRNNLRHRGLLERSGEGIRTKWKVTDKGMWAYKVYEEAKDNERE